MERWGGFIFFPGLGVVQGVGFVVLLEPNSWVVNLLGASFDRFCLLRRNSQVYELKSSQGLPEGTQSYKLGYAQAIVGTACFEGKVNLRTHWSSSFIIINEDRICCGMYLGL